MDTKLTNIQCFITILASSLADTARFQDKFLQYHRFSTYIGGERVGDGVDGEPKVGSPKHWNRKAAIMCSWKYKKGNIVCQVERGTLYLSGREGP